LSCATITAFLLAGESSNTRMCTNIHGTPLTTRNETDHICLNRRWRRSVLNVRTRRRADIDHELVVTKIKMK